VSVREQIGLLNRFSLVKVFLVRFFFFKKKKNTYNQGILSTMRKDWLTVTSESK